jgi:hypothetical protein
MKKNKRDNAKTPTNNTVAKLNPTPQKRTLNTHARTRAQKRKFVDPQSLTISHEKLPQKLNHKKKNSITGKLDNKHQSNSKRGSKQSKKKKLKTL